MQLVHGDTTALKPSEHKALLALHRRRLPPERILTPDLARELCELSGRLGRQVGLLVDRGGAVTHVLLGDAERLFIPDLGRARAGRQRFRGLRLLHTHVRGEPLSRDDLTDLALLRLDLVLAIVVGDAGLPGPLQYATLLPPGAGADPLAPPWRIEGPLRVHALVEDVRALIAALEGEFAEAVEDVARGDERPRAILVGVEAAGERGLERRMDELARLAESAGLRVIDTIVQRREAVDPRTLLGKGKLDELLVRSMSLGADILVFDRDLSPSQGRTIGDATELKVLDRTQLILDIFAQRAGSADGRLQVELAQLRYLLPRLAQMQRSLSRLTGGIGGRGPGETTLEIKGRRARDRIARLERDLVDLARRRDVRRAARQRAALPVVGLVGYTNAGKSTLLNALTRSDVDARDALFATLDTTSRRMVVPDAREVIVTDTVGFIEHLPADLMRAFAATLEELVDADLLLHVVDASDEHAALQSAVVAGVLTELGLGATPVLVVLNKVDAATPEQLGELRRLHPDAVALSALRREGLDALLAAIDAALRRVGLGDARPRWQVESAQAVARALAEGGVSAPELA